MSTSLIKSETAYIFPGQGAQILGMGNDLFQDSPPARKIFSEADDFLGYDLSKIMFNGPQDELTQTVHAQPAIFTMSIACYESLRQQKKPSKTPEPAMFVAGHSLGEYTALVASNSLDFKDALHLVKERGRLMQDASNLIPTGMAAILGLEELVIVEICQATGTFVSNVNTAEQIVISGAKIPLAHAMDMALLRGAKRAIPLKVSGAFHSNYMQPAQDEMQILIDEAPIRDPEIPVIGNCTGEPLYTASDVRKELSNQLCTCVQWKKSIESMVTLGVNNFIEMGPGSTLSGLVKRINPSVYTHSLNSLIGIRRMTN